MIREAKEKEAIEITPDNMTFTSVIHRKSDDERIDFFIISLLHSILTLKIIGGQTHL